MKTNRLFAGVVGVAMALAVVANSQETPPKPAEKATEGAKQGAQVDPFSSDGSSPMPALVQVQVEHVEMSHEALTKLLFLAKPTSPDATSLRMQVQEMVAKNEAKVLETQMVVARSSQKGASESIHEFIYPSEYELPSGASVGNKDVTPPPQVTAGFPFNPATPTAFDTRNVGSTLEVEPVVSDDNKIIDVRLVPELVWHTGNRTWHEGKDQAGNPFRVQMPDISVVRLNTSITCLNGQYTLAGVLSPKDDKGEVDMTRKLMVFVKCDVLVVK